MTTALGRLSPPRRRLYLAIITVVVLVVAISLGRALVKQDPAPVAVAQDVLGPVLLIPGYGGSTASLDALRLYLSSTGRDVSIVDPVGDGTGDLREQAVAVRQAVRRALRANPATSVDLVGYSAGGVIMRLYLAELGGAAVTRRAVSLGSPHHGTNLAALAAGVAGGACPEACRQLAPDSELLLDLNRGDETPDGPLWVSIWTNDDQTVVPASSGSLEGALDYAVQDVCPRATVSHGELPRTAATIAMVESALGTSRPVLPDVAVCDAEITFAR